LDGATFFRPIAHELAVFVHHGEHQDELLCFISSWLNLEKMLESLSILSSIAGRVVSSFRPVRRLSFNMLKISKEILELEDASKEQSVETLAAIQRPP
jgi:hypothetical protein